MMICRGADRSAVIADGPPWPLTEAELREVIAGAGLVDESLCSFEDDEDPPVRRMRGVFHRG